MMHRSKCFFNWGNVPESHSLQQELIRQSVWKEKYHHNTSGLSHWV